MTITLTPQELADHEEKLIRWTRAAQADLIEWCFKQLIPLQFCNEQDLAFAARSYIESKSKSNPRPKLLP